MVIFEWFLNLLEYVFLCLWMFFQGILFVFDLVIMIIGELCYGVLDFIGLIMVESVVEFGKYFLNEGMLDLLVVILGWIQCCYGISVEFVCIMVLNGMCEGLFNVVFVLCFEIKVGGRFVILILNLFYQVYVVVVVVVGVEVVFVNVGFQIGFLL